VGQLEAVQLRQAEVGDHDVRPVRGGFVRGTRSRVRHPGVMAPRSDQEGQNVGRIAVAVRDQHTQGAVKVLGRHEAYSQ
jgi:hypothetical protein